MTLKIFHSKRRLLAFFMPGFLFGVVYVNLIAKKYIAELGIFSDYFLNQFQTAGIAAEEYFWYLFRLRVIPFLVLLGLSFTKMRKAAAVLFLIWTGISGGILISTAVLSMGIKGSLLCAVGILPQFIFYVPAYLILLWCCYSYPKTQWNRQKAVFAALAVSSGMILEIFVNPSLVKAFLSTL